jgi:hypothetical protein
MKKADPTQISPWPASQNLGAFCGQIAPMVSVLPVVPVRKYCAVYYLAHDSYHGMEEVIGSIPTRSCRSRSTSDIPCAPLSHGGSRRFRTHRIRPIIQRVRRHRVLEKVAFEAGLCCVFSFPPVKALRRLFAACPTAVQFSMSNPNEHGGRLISVFASSLQAAHVHL